MKGEIAVRTGFAKDPYGCHGNLKKKREERDPFNVGVSYTTPYLSQIFRYCSTKIYKGPLPW